MAESETKICPIEMLGIICQELGIDECLGLTNMPGGSHNIKDLKAIINRLNPEQKRLMRKDFEQNANLGGCFYQAIILAALD